MDFDKRVIHLKRKSVKMLFFWCKCKTILLLLEYSLCVGSFRKHVQKYADFVFVTAPHDVEAPAENSRIDEGDGSGDDSDMEDLSKQKSWWFNSPADGRSFKGTNKNGPAIGFDESLHLVEEAWQSLGPFHGLLGFSQGACFAGLICNLSQRGSKYD